MQKMTNSPTRQAKALEKAVKKKQIVGISHIQNVCVCARNIFTEFYNL